MMNTRVEMNEEMMAQVNGGDGLENVIDTTTDILENTVFKPICQPIDWAHRLINHLFG